MKDVTFGAYYPTTSFVHKMDARIKILLTIAYIVSIFLITSKGLFHFAGFIPCFAFLFLAVACAKVPVIKVIKSIKAIILQIPVLPRYMIYVGISYLILIMCIGSTSTGGFMYARF